MAKPIYMFRNKGTNIYHIDIADKMYLASVCGDIAISYDCFVYEVSNLKKNNKDQKWLALLKKLKRREYCRICFNHPSIVFKNCYTFLRELSDGFNDI